MNILRVGRTLIKSTLEANAAYRALLVYPNAPGVYRTFGDHVPANVPTPYVTVEWYAGGADDKARGTDSKTMWKIAGHVLEEGGEPLAVQIQDAIYEALHGKYPVLLPDAQVGGYAPIILQYPYSDAITRQGKTLIRMGGIYTVRLSELR